MPNYVCSICNKKFKNKSGYNYHINKKKTPCMPSKKDMIDKIQSGNDSTEIYNTQIKRKIYITDVNPTAMVYYYKDVIEKKDLEISFLKEVIKEQAKKYNVID